MFWVSAEWWAIAGLAGALAIAAAKAFAAGGRGQVDAGLWVVVGLLILSLACSVRALRNRKLGRAEQRVRAWRQSRHSLFNHLQVIAGWLQLERPERARGYIESLTARSADYRGLFDRVGDELAAELIGLVDAAEAAGIGLRLSSEDDRADALSPYALPALAGVIQNCRVTGERPAELVVGSGKDGSVTIGLFGIDVSLAADAVRRAVGSGAEVSVVDTDDGAIIVGAGRRN